MSICRTVARRRMLRGKPTFIAGVVALCLLSASCSSANTSRSGASTPTKDSSTPASMAKAQANVDALSKAPTYRGPTEPVDLSKVRGKTIYFVAFDLSNAFNKSILDNFTEAAAVMGVKVVALNGQVNSALESTYVDQAVKANAAAIMLLSVGAEQVPASLQNAAAAHIPVITMAQRTAGGDPGKNITNQATVNTTDVGKAQVDLAYVMSKGNINAVGYGGNSLPQDVSQWDGQAARIKELCPDTCKYDNKNINLTSFQTQLPTIARAAITADKNLNWFLPTWDILAGYVAPGIKQAGADGRVQYSSWNGIPAAVQSVSDGTEAATIGVPLRWWGWAAADMAARYIAGQTVAPDAENLPVRLFTKATIEQAGSTSDETKLYGDSAVFDTYKKLWGVS